MKLLRICNIRRFQPNFFEPCTLSLHPSYNQVPLLPSNVLPDFYLYLYNGLSSIELIPTIILCPFWPPASSIGSHSSVSPFRGGTLDN